MKCSKCAATRKELIEKDTAYDFLVGLNFKFHQVRFQVLGKEEVLSLNEAISFMWPEENQRSVESQLVETSTLIINRE